MFNAIVALKNADVGNTYHSKPYQKAYEQLRDNKLAPNCVYAHTHTTGAGWRFIGPDEDWV